MAIDSRKPKKWVRIASGPSYGFTIARVLLLKGPYSTALLALACSYLALCHPAQPCPALNTSTTSSVSPCLLNLALP